MMRLSVWLLGLALVVAAVAQPSAQARTGARAGGTATGNPVLAFETVKGPFEVELFPGEAPKSVEHILALVRRNFYNGLRVHRLVAGFVVQFGDPQTRDMTKRPLWGNGGSGREIGALEVSPKRPHRLGAVALAREEKRPGSSDSQLYIALSGLENPSIAGINGKYTVIGQVTSGMANVQKLQVTDVIRRVTVKAPVAASK
jgi:cyclophilin family peptidyl-prolyl cis-trans isomerase